MSRGRRLAYAAIIVVASVALDQTSKEWALNKLESGRTIDVLPTVEFDLAFNSGFSFSTGSGRGNLVGLLVIALCIFIGWQIWRESRPVRAFLYAVILGGAIGNLLDRVFRADDGFLSGEVIDFIDVSCTPSSTWPTCSSSAVVSRSSSTNFSATAPTEPHKLAMRIAMTLSRHRRPARSEIAPGTIRRRQTFTVRWESLWGPKRRLPRRQTTRPTRPTRPLLSELPYVPIAAALAGCIGSTSR